MLGDWGVVGVVAEGCICVSAPQRDGSLSVPACHTVTNFRAAARHQRAERLGVKQLPGSGRGRVYCPGDNGRDLT